VAASFGTRRGGIRKVIDAKSPFTFQHSERVAHDRRRPRYGLGFDAAGRRELRPSALLHDIGKLRSRTRSSTKLPLDRKRGVRAHEAASGVHGPDPRARHAFVGIATIGGNPSREARRQRLSVGARQRALAAARILVVSDIYECADGCAPLRTHSSPPSASIMARTRRRACPETSVRSDQRLFRGV